MDEARDQGSAGNDSVPPRVIAGALMAGVLLALWPWPPGTRPATRPGSRPRPLPDLGRRLVFIHGPDHGPSAETTEDSVDARIRGLYPVLLDTTGETSLAYYAVSVPTAYRLNAEGTVAAAARGVGPVLELVEELAEDVASDEGCRSCP